jgi:hypothetical protein
MQTFQKSTRFRRYESAVRSMVAGTEPSGTRTSGHTPGTSISHNLMPPTIPAVFASRFTRPVSLLGS